MMSRRSPINRLTGKLRFATKNDPAVSATELVKWNEWNEGEMSVTNRCANEYTNEWKCLLLYEFELGETKMKWNENEMN